MPNLVGIWSPASTPEEIQRILEAQLRRVRVPGISYQVYQTLQAGFGMALMDHGLLENGPQPAQSADGRFSLLLDGELYNAEDLRHRFRNNPSSSSPSTPKLCLELVLQEGEDILRSLNGLYCLALYDQKEKRLRLMSDRYGFRSLFYRAEPGSFLFASELKALCVAAGTPRKIDEIGLAELFCYGIHMGERTWMQDCLRIAPATILTVDEQGVRSRAYWIYKYKENPARLDQETYFTVFAKLLDRAVERCMQGTKRIGILLSGGYDSRSVAASIRKHHLPIPALTFGHSESRDVRYAAMLAQRLGLEHTAPSDRGPYLYNNCREIVWRTEGMLSFANTTSTRYHAGMKQKMDILLTGILAEFGGSHTWPRLLLARSRQEAIQVIFDRILGSRLSKAQRIFSPSFFQHAMEAIRARFEQSFERVENDHPLNIADCWNVIYLQPRGTYHAPSIDRHQFEARAPHMDSELVDFLLTIPPYARLEQRVYKKMIAYCFPEIRDVPCTNSGRPINPHFVREYATLVGEFLGRKISAPFEKLFHSDTSLGREFRDLNDDFRAEPEVIDGILRPLLKAGVYPENIFDRRSIEAIVDEHYQKNGKHENIISLLISWGLAAKYFLHDDFAEVPSSIFIP